MVDIFTESVVKRKPMPGGSTLESVCKWLCLGSVGLFLGMSVIFAVPAVVFGVAWFFVRQNADVEFEYAHTNGEFDIDKGIANSSRKRAVSVDLSRVEIVAPADSPELERYESLKRADYSAKDPENPPYGMVCVVKGERKLLLLQLDEKMLASLRKWMPSKVVK